MKKYGRWLALPLALLLQVTVLPEFISPLFRPDFLLMLNVRTGLKVKPLKGGVHAFLLGLLADTFSGLHFGMNGFAFLVVYLLITRVADTLYTENAILIVITVFAASVVKGLCHLFLLVLFPSAPGMYVSILSGLLPHATVNAAAVAALLLLRRTRIPVLGAA